MSSLFRSVSFLSLAYFVSTALAFCECGYSVNSTSSSNHVVFTELQETDFLHISDLKDDIGWRPQVYNVTPDLARGPYGKNAQLENVVANPLKDPWSWNGPSVNGSDAGLQLWSRREPQNDMIGMGEIASDRTDMWYGSFRVAMKISAVPGTCGAFFWFRNDTQEIDMEFLSKQFNETSNPVNLVLQSPASQAAGFDAQYTPGFELYPLPFKPSEGFHEYRFDWLPGKVSFYADGQWLRDMVLDTPDSPGHLVLNHWSNGDPFWSAGPPEQDAVLTVSYVKAYFNSSDADRRSSYEKRCDNGDVAKVCQIPDQTTAPDPAGPNGNATARTYFFTQDKEHTPHQILYEAPDNPFYSAAGGRQAAFAASLPSLAVACVVALASLMAV